MFRPASFFYPASHDKRFAAHLIDTAVCTVLSKLASILILRMGVPFDFSVLFFIIYYVAAVVVWGATPGKKIMGLRIIQDGLDERPSFLKVLGRETIGKLLSFFLFSLGFLLILIDKRHQGLHDKLFQTQVVSDYPQDRGAFFKLVGQSVSISAVGLCLVYYVFMYTSYPLRKLSEELSVQGLVLENIQGNLKNGFQIEKVSFSDHELDLTFENVVFQYEDFWSFQGAGGIHIHQLSASRADVKIKSGPTRSPLAGKAGDSQLPVAKSNNEKGRKSADIKVDRVDISNFQWTYVDKKPFQVKRFVVSEMSIRDQIFKLGGIWIDSDLVQGNVDGFELNGESKEFSVANSRFLIRRGVNPELMVGDIDLAASGSLNFNSLKGSALVKGFRESVSVQYKDGELQLRAKDFQPRWYLKNAPMIHAMNLEFKGSPFALLLPQIEGNYKIGPTLFVLKKSEVPGQLLYAQAVTPKPLFASLKFDFNGKSSSSVVVHLHAVGSSNFDDVLSEVLFNRRKAELNAEQVALLSRQQPHFTYESAAERDRQRRLALDMVNLMLMMKQGPRAPSGSRVPESPRSGH